MSRDVEQRSLRALVGREPELHALRTALQAALQGRASVALIAGEAGIGKTRLVEALVGEAQAAGAETLWGGADAPGAPAFWAWSQALRAHVGHIDPVRLAAEVGAGGAEISALVPDVQRILPGLALLPAMSAEGSRYELFDAVARMLGAAAGRQPLVVVLDDLHAADPDSLSLLEFVGRELRDAALLLVATYRPDEAPGRRHLQQAVGELARSRATTLLHLGGLPPAEIGVLIESVTGSAPRPATVEALHRHTGGNPFFVIESVRLLEAQGALDDPALAMGGAIEVPPSVRAVVVGRLATASERCGRVLGLAAALGPTFTLDLLVEAVGRGEDEILDALEEAVVTGLVRETATPGRFAFAHALVHEVVGASMSRARQVQFHRRFAQVLEARLAEVDDTELVSEVAYHWCAAGKNGDTEKALHYATLAAERAMAQHGYEEAARGYER
ncbi:MAG: ATP-binding protein, partial [Acidimicrobiales bacterium]